MSLHLVESPWTGTFSLHETTNYTLYIYAIDLIEFVGLYTLIVTNDCLQACFPPQQHSRVHIPPAPRAVEAFGCRLARTLTPPCAHVLLHRATHQTSQAIRHYSRARNAVTGVLIPKPKPSPATFSMGTLRYLLSSADRYNASGGC